jgi:hypothetical protein
MVLLFLFTSSMDEVRENPLRVGAAVEVSTGAVKSSSFRNHAPPAQVQDEPSQAQSWVPPSPYWQLSWDEQGLWFNG